MLRLAQARLLHMSAAAAAAGGGAAAKAGPIATSMQLKLTEALQPVSLSIQNDSHKHAGHSGNPSGAPDAETHFKVDVVSAAFEGKNPVQRHRLVYQLLAAEIEAGVHALALKTKTPAEAGTA
ncbi:bola [Micractinium conductrix]|uniref:Bola n=1 Tax=Micractinium conductrix TaxID=554055 RepID=A0A2P6V9L3_9CHLO|nr:bola [Micractinium conductrix]|eukprot:PSC70779.1 bola [Micractinium conductrix]